MAQDSLGTRRRDFLASGGAALIAPALIGAVPAGGAGSDIVETTQGKLRGRLQDGVTSFKGIRYAADTSGANRFMPPRPAPGWAGVRDAFEAGDRCVQNVRPPAPGAASPFRYSEDCCVLNVFTPATGTSSKRAVMVYIHGGGFRNGGGDSPTQDGANLAKFGDVVVVTLNHRLNLFGYANLAHLGPEYAHAGHAGQLDLIAALKWIRANIRAFGGDPQRVTLFGESGGGAKIVTLAMMPAARGLYRGTINMSGAGAFFLPTPEQTARVTDEMLRVIGASKANTRPLREATAQQLIAVHEEVLARLKADQLRPLVDGRNVTVGPMSAQGVALMAAMPGIMSCTATEATPWLLRERRNLQVDGDELLRRVKAQFKYDDARARAVIDAYKSTDPAQTPWDLLVNIMSDMMMCIPMRRALEARADAHRQPVWFCDFGWKSPAEGGIWGGPHGVDVPFAFGNVAKERLAQGAGQGALDASRNLMAAYSAFARNGTPDNAFMPRWKPYDTLTRTSMVVDARCSAVDDRFAARREVAATLPVQQTFEVTEGPLAHGTA